MKEVEMEKRFHALRTISMILKVMAWIVAIFTVIGFIFTLAGVTFLPGPYGSGAGFVFGIGVLIYGAIIFIWVYALAEIILVLLAIEENTRGIRPE